MKIFNTFLVGLSLTAHASRWYVLKNDWAKIPPNFSSICITLAAALFTVQRLEMPKTRYPWPNHFANAYKVVVMFFLPTIVQCYIWLPLTFQLAASQEAIAKTLVIISPASRPELFTPVVNLLTCKATQAIVQMLISMDTLYSVLLATGYYCQLKTWLASLKTQCTAPAPKPACKPKAKARPPSPDCSDSE